MTLAVYTTVYPGVEGYLPDWFRSLSRQTDKEFQLWIGLDSLEVGTIERLLGGEVNAHWVVASGGATTAQIRQQALSRIVETCSGVVLVDSDDVLHPTRVAAARAGLEENDLVGCALRLVDQRGNDIGATFGLPPELEPDEVFPRNNVFGFSNSAFRSNLLKRCLPIPACAVLVDWFVATRAWLLGARLAFDPEPRMSYRQHPTNTARVTFPFKAEQVISDTALVRQHFQLVLADLGPSFLVPRVGAVRSVEAEVEAFHQNVVHHAASLATYVEALNDLRPAPLWWSTVANPALQHMWTSGKVEI